MLIGVAPLSAQTPAGSVDAADLCGLQGRGTRFFAALQRLLHQESIKNWPDGWALAQRVGPAALPVLRGALKQEANGLKRLLLIGAVTAATAGSDRDSWLLELVGSPRLEEQALGWICLAIGPRREVALPASVATVLDDPHATDTCASVGAALVSIRFAGVANSERRPSSAESVTAALRGDLPLEMLRRLQAKLGDPHGHAAAALSLRAALLGSRGRSEVLASVAEDLLRDPATPPAVKVAAAVQLGRGGDAFVADAVLDARVRATLAAFPPARARLRELGGLGPVPEVLADARTRAVLAAAYALATPWPQLVREVDQWQQEAPLAEAITLVLAWRLLTADTEVPAEVSVIAQRARSTRGGFWLGWAAGQSPSADALGVEDPRARRIGVLALEGRIARPAVAREVEDALWRSGAHPGRVIFSAWCDLVRDAMLAGSDQVSARLQIDDAPPLPRGLENAGGKFFLVADSLHRFFTERVPSPPPECRLQ